jgi:hypothetical protein
MEIDNPTNIKITPVETVSALAAVVCIIGFICWVAKED